MILRDIPFIGLLFKKKEKCLLDKLQDSAKKLTPVTELIPYDLLTKWKGFADKDYAYVDLEVLKEFNLIYKEYRPNYKHQVFDCDNYSIDYAALFYRFINMIDGQKHQMALGWCRGYFEWMGDGYHQCNFIITKTGVKLLEPQTGMIYELEKATKINYKYL